MKYMEMDNIMLRLSFYVFIFTILISSCSPRSQTNSVETKRLAINADSVRARQNPSVDGAIIMILNKGDTVALIQHGPQATIEGRTGEWLQVTLPNPPHSSGWVFGAFVADYSASAEYSFQKAQGMEQSNPQGAIILYRKISIDFPKAQTQEAHQVFDYASDARERVQIIQCILSDTPGLPSFEDAKNELVKSLKTSDRAGLERCAACELTAGAGPADFHFPRLQGVQFVLNSKINLDWANPQIRGNNLYLPLIIPNEASVNTSPFYAQFKFAKSPTGWKWVYFHANSTVLTPD